MKSVCTVNNAEDRSKSKENRLEEKNRLEAELERSLAVAKVKEAHRQIEQTEKLRKRPIAQSICKRIDSFMAALMPMMNVLSKPEYQELQTSEPAISTVDMFDQLYTSISYDFQKSLDVGNESMQRMFPTITVRKDTLSHAIIDLLNVCTQLQQMKSYCERLVT